MTVRFKCRSEYQKSYRVPRSRSVSPHHSVPLAGLRSDQMGISREPCLQRRRKFTQSCSSLLFPPDPQPVTSEKTPRAGKTAPLAASRSRSAHRREASTEPKPPTPDPGSPAEPETPPGEPGPAAEPEPVGEPAADEAPAKPRPSKADSQSQPSRPATAAPDGQQPSANDGHRALRWKAGLRSGGQRSGGQRSEYNRQFGWKKPVRTASPLLTAERVLYSSSRVIPPFKANPVAMDTEYRRSFKGLIPPTGPRLHTHLEQQRVPLFHTHMVNKKRREESGKKPRPRLNETTPPPSPQVQRGHRSPEGGVAMDTVIPQLQELRQKASWYRQRAWGANFCRDHLNQLLSQNNALWEPSTSSSCTSSSSSSSSTRHSNGEPNPTVEPLDLPSPSSQSSAGKQDDEDEGSDEEGRLPTPRLKLLPVQRTHLDLTTPATGGTLLVGKAKGTNDHPGSEVVTEAPPPPKPKEAWSEGHSSPGPAPEHRPAVNQPPKPIRAHLGPPPPHCIQGTMRHADFQHNGDLGLRFRDLQCSGGGCGSDEDDRLSVMSWRSAASCSVASAVLERAQRRRENFWGKS